MKNIVYILSFVLVLSVVIYSCKQQPQQAKVAVPGPENTFAIHGSVREMNINPATVDFPDQPGRNEFTSYCSMCHSLKYISMQPDFPRKTWESEVNKMVQKYKAPIDSVTCLKIVDYLVKIKTKV